MSISPLREAVLNNDPEKVRRLCEEEKESHIDQPEGPLGLTHLQEACIQKNVTEIRIVKSLLEKKADPNKPVMLEGKKTSLIYLLVSAEKENFLSFFLREKIPTTFPERDPLFLSILIKRIDILGPLLQAKAEVNQKDNQGNNLLHKIARIEERDLPSSTVSMLIKFKADPHAPNERGKTPLQVAKEKRRISLVQAFKKLDEKEPEKKQNA